MKTTFLFHLEADTLAAVRDVADRLTHEQGVRYTVAMLLREGADMVVAKYVAKGQEPAPVTLFEE